jgi:hypothetical protein
MKRKAGPPKEVVSSPQVRRRAKTAHVTVRKDTMLMQADSPPRTAWGAKSRKIKKM